PLTARVARRTPRERLALPPAHAARRAEDRPSGRRDPARHQEPHPARPGHARPCTHRRNGCMSELALGSTTVLQEVRARAWLLGWWAGGRALVFGTALTLHVFGPRGLIGAGERTHLLGALATWDGRWYRTVAANGYLLEPGRQSDPRVLPAVPDVPPRLARDRHRVRHERHHPLERDAARGACRLRAAHARAVRCAVRVPSDRVRRPLPDGLRVLDGVPGESRALRNRACRARRIAAALAARRGHHRARDAGTPRGAVRVARAPPACAAGTLVGARARARRGARAHRRARKLRGVPPADAARRVRVDACRACVGTE